MCKMLLVRGKTPTVCDWIYIWMCLFFSVVLCKQSLTPVLLIFFVVCLLASVRQAWQPVVARDECIFADWCASGCWQPLIDYALSGSESVKSVSHTGNQVSTLSKCCTLWNVLQKVTILCFRCAAYVFKCSGNKHFSLVICGCQDVVDCFPSVFLCCRGSTAVF